MEDSNTESKDRPGSETKNEPAAENDQTIKASLPILSIIKDLYDACGVPMYEPAATPDVPELPRWAKNICEQLRLTIFKRVLELRPEGEKIDWHNFGRMLGVCQRLAAYLKNGRAEKSKEASKPNLAPPTDLLEQVEVAFVDSMDAALAQKVQSQCEYLSGLAEGYEMFLDTQGQFTGDRGRTALYFELLSRWLEIEEMRQAQPPVTCNQLYQLLAPKLGDPGCKQFEWFKVFCKEIGLSMTTQGRPCKSKVKKR